MPQGTFLSSEKRISRKNISKCAEEIISTASSYPEAVYGHIGCPISVFSIMRFNAFNYNILSSTTSILIIKSPYENYTIFGQNGQTKQSKIAVQVVILAVQVVLSQTY